MTQEKSTTGQAIVAELEVLFKNAVTKLRTAIETYIADGTLPDPAWRNDGSFAYPEIHVNWSGDASNAEPQRSFGRLTGPGHYATSITKPKLFADYLTEQINILVQDYGVSVEAP